jgi:hypothetical protein
MNKLFIPLIAFMAMQGASAHSATLYTPTAKDSTEVKAKKVSGDKGDKTEKSKKDKKDEKLSDYAKLIKKGGSVQKGLFTVRHIENKWYFEVPQDKLGKLFLIVTRFTSVPAGFKYNIGEEVNENVVYLEKHADALWLRSYVNNVETPEGSDISRSVEKATVNPIVASFPIIKDSVKQAKDHGWLIDVTNFYTQDNKITSFDNSDKGILKIGGVQKDLTVVDTICSLPVNIEARTLRTYSANGGGTPAAKTGYVTLGLNTSIVQLPDNPMQPRYADERVGYFETKKTELSDYGITSHTAFISRYRLEPKNEKAYLAGKLTEPKKPIIYYIDPATPKKWVPYLMAGINDWNKAFEAAGFKNAIQAREWPEDDKGMSVDDARFCVLRYLPSEKENAYGPRIVDPRSGEIIESHICWYHDVTELLRKWYMVQCGPLDKQAQTMNFSDELMGQLIRFVSSHEVGHTLGLRHNMIASSATPVEKLRDKAWVDKYGHTASIMDYARFNYVAQPEDGMSERDLFPRINDYDKWAIKWGYQWRPEFKGDAKKEKAALRAEVTKVLAANPRLRYVGDEGKGMDPRSQTEDLGDNSMKASDYGIKNLKRVMAHLREWTAQPDGQTEYLEEMYKGVLGQYRRYCMHVQRNIVGMYHNNWPAEKAIDYVSKERQKEALEWFGRNIFTVPEWLYDKNITSRIAYLPDNDITSLTTTLIWYLINPNLLNNQRKGGKYPVGEYLDDVFSIIWKPLTGMSEYQAAWRRAEENAFVRFLDKGLNNPSADKEAPLQLNTNNSDVFLYLLQTADKTENYLTKQLQTTPKGSLNYLHYNNLLLKVKQLKAKYNKVE